MDFKNKVVLVTGASAGIGQQLVITLSQRGAKVIGLARSFDQPKTISSSKLSSGAISSRETSTFTTMRMDVTSDDSVKEAFQQIIQKYGQIDMLINNAAVGMFEEVRHSRISDARTVFETNVFGPLRCIRESLPYMDKGIIINISSAISKHASAYQGIYAGSKSALDRLSEALRIEESKKNIKVFSIFIDRTKTNFREHVVGPKDKLTLPFKGLKENSPEEIAQKIIQTVEGKQYVAHLSLKSRLFSIGAGILPSLINRLFTKQYDK